ncbi:MAG: O-antigen ligase family protein [Elusimicrobiota bacterium]
MKRYGIIITNYIFAAGMLISHICGYAAAGIGLFFSLKSLKGFVRERIALLFVVFLAYGLLRSVFSPEPGTGFMAMLGYFSQWTLPFLLGYSLAELKDVKRVFWILCGVYLLILLLSVLAYFGLFYQKLAADTFLVGDEDGLLKGLRSHIAFAALCLLFSFLFISQSFFSKEASTAKKALFVVLAVIPLGAMFLTGSRGYYLATAVSYSLFALFWVISTKRWKLVIGFAAVALLISAGLYQLFPNIRYRLQNTGMHDRSVIGRVALYKVAVREILANPVFGVGPGQGTRQKQYFLELTEYEKMLSRHGHLHSIYLNTAAEFGLTGFALAALIFIEILRRLRSFGFSGAGFENALAIGLFWGIIGILIGDVFDTLLRGPGTAMELFWLSGLVFGLAGKHK